MTKFLIFQLTLAQPTDNNHGATKCIYNSVSLVVGGEKTRTAEYPHNAALGFQNFDGIKWSCGGSLISDKFVLTAGKMKNLLKQHFNY